MDLQDSEWQPLMMKKLEAKRLCPQSLGRNACTHPPARKLRQSWLACWVSTLHLPELCAHHQPGQSLVLVSLQKGCITEARP